MRNKYSSKDTGSSWPSIKLLGVEIDNLSLDQLLGSLRDFVSIEGKAVVTYVNVHALNMAVGSETYRRFLNGSSLVYCDGYGVWLGALLSGQYLFTRNTPPDFIERISALVVRENLRMFFLGSQPGIAESAAKKLRADFPQIQIRAHHGYFDKSYESAECTSVVDEINEYRPDILLVGFGVPLQEQWVSENLDRLDVRIAFPVGALFDYMAGYISRAPRWVTDYGFEWLGRLIIEPKRLWRRYILGNPLFFLRVIWYDLLGFPLPSFEKVVDIKVMPTSYSKAVQKIVAWAERSESRYVCAANVHMTMEAHDSKEFQQVVNTADLVTPDGMPLVWMMRAQGIPEQERVYGPDLALHTVAAAAKKGIPIGLYGSSPHTLAAFEKSLQMQYPKLNIVYVYSPPFRDLTLQEDIQISEDINKSGARILLVGLGCPKQERWMAAHRGRIQMVMLGVGAAFDIHSGLRWQAPMWMQRSGLEWFFRLLQEPRRLWKRYLYQNPRFVFLAVRQLLRRTV